MLLSNARTHSQGFTVIELLIILLIVGTLSAMSVPSFLGLLNRSKVNNAVAQVQGALQEAQREAIRKSRICKVYVPDKTYLPNGTYLPYGTELISNCFVTNDKLSKGLSSFGIPDGLPSKTLDVVAIATNLTTTPAKKITFSFRGNTNTEGKFVLYMPANSTQEKRCLVISNGIGLMRTGKYSGSTSSATDINAGTCITPK